MNKWTTGIGMLAVAAALAGCTGKGGLEDRLKESATIKGLEDRVAALEAKSAALETRSKGLEDRTQGLEDRTTGIETKMAGPNK